MLASFPDFPHVAYIVLTFELAHAKSIVLFARARLKVNIIYATWGESGNKATYMLYMLHCIYMYM